MNVLLINHTITQNPNGSTQGFLCPLRSIKESKPAKPTHLAGCSHCSVGSQVETSLSKPHHGFVTPVFGLCDVLVYLLQPGPMSEKSSVRHDSKRGTGAWTG